MKPKDKDQSEDQSGVVYQISCKECSAKYIGQTGRQLGERLKEHKRATQKGYYLESGVAEHVINTGHDIDWSAEVLAKDLKQMRRLVREAVMIRRNKPS